MTSEEDFVQAIDLEPNNYHLRLIYADWLEEQGDERAMGYRALGTQKKNGCNSRWSKDLKHLMWIPDQKCCWFSEASGNYELFGRLPDDWFRLLNRARYPHQNETDWYANRKEGEDDAARAFLRLPAERQQELLARPVLV